MIHKSHTGFLRLVFLISLISIFVMLPGILLAKTVKVESSQARIRKGPGNYYEIIYRAQKGAELDVIEEKEGWYAVRLPDKSMGYVNIKSLSISDMGKTKKAGWKDDKGVGTVASSEIMAATKGITDMGRFAKEYARKHDLDTSIIEQFNNIPFNPDEYEKFRNTLHQKGKVSAKGISNDGITDMDREIGMAIAMRLAKMGVLTDNDLRKYISMVGTGILENTPLDYETFIFIIIDSPKVQSFALPGGFIFVTTGALKLMQNEAELAGVLSHEIIHVVQRHGIRELEKQQTRIAGEKMMDELDTEIDKLGMDSGDRKLMAEMDEMTDSMYDLIISGRKKESEDESDILGAIIMYNTGYNPDGLENFISSTGKLSEKDKDPSYSHRSTAERTAAIDKIIKKYKLDRKDREYFMERFNNLMKGM